MLAHFDGSVFLTLDIEAMLAGAAGIAFIILMLVLLYQHFKSRSRK
jgi:hypothetical protein